MVTGIALAAVAAVIGGLLVAAQGPIYARLSAGLNRDPLIAVFLAFMTASVATGALVALSGRYRSASVSALASLPPWVWLGGLLGACHVVISMEAIPLLGAVAFLSLVIAGNLIGAAVYDYVGAFGLPQRPLVWKRVAGLSLVLLGAVVTLRS